MTYLYLSLPELKVDRKHFIAQRSREDVESALSLFVEGLVVEAVELETADKLILRNIVTVVDLIAK